MSENDDTAHSDIASVIAKSSRPPVAERRTGRADRLNVARDAFERLADSNAAGPTEMPRNLFAVHDCTDAPPKTFLNGGAPRYQ